MGGIQIKIQSHVVDRTLIRGIHVGVSDVEDQLPLKCPSPEVDDALHNCLWGSKKKIILTIAYRLCP